MTWHWGLLSPRLGGLHAIRHSRYRENIPAAETPVLAHQRRVSSLGVTGLQDSGLSEVASVSRRSKMPSALPEAVSRVK
ncbi:hypothetical protein D3C87_1891270 [compost metagenome]